MTWLSSTFLHVRLSQNPAHYKLDGNNVNFDLDRRVELICTRDMSLLQGAELIVTSSTIRPTDFGNAMARYCINFNTMKAIRKLPHGAKISEIVCVFPEPLSISFLTI